MHTKCAYAAHRHQRREISRPHRITKIRQTQPTNRPTGDRKMRKPLPSMARLLNRCTLAHFIVDPVPPTLAQSLSLYMNMSSLGGDIIEYKHDMCPVTRQRLPKLRVLLHDHTREELPQEQLRDLYTGGKLAVDYESLSDLEKALINTEKIALDGEVSYDFKMIFMTRKLASMTAAKSRTQMAQADNIGDDKTKRLEAFMDVFRQLEQKHV